MRTVRSAGAEHDWELELAAVMGGRAYRVSRRDALGYVAGYTIVKHHHP